MNLPADIEQVFSDTLNGEMSVPEFEDWLYVNEQLEALLSAEDYLELISFGYKAENVKRSLYPLLEKYIDKGKFEKKRIRTLLLKALNKDKELPEILMKFYDFYCRGYHFLEDLGLNYGLAIEVPRAGNLSANGWYELRPEEQEMLLSSFYPQLEKEIIKVIKWIDDGKVVLTGIKDEYSHFEYIDNRTESEKKTTSFEIISFDNKTRKPWWKIW